MLVSSNGFKSHRDSFVITFSENEIKQKIEEFIDKEKSNYQLLKKYNLSETKQWNIQKVRNALRNQKDWIKDLLPCLYRPFDIRYCYHNKLLMDRPRNTELFHVRFDNICFAIGRQGQAVGGDQWNLLTIGKYIADTNLFYRGGIQYFPLYFYPDPDKPKELQQEKRPNFSSDFLKTIESKLGYLPTPEAIFYYIYGIFHSPTYRTRYAEFLKIDFPRVPLTSNNDLFIQLSNYGEQLVQLHLMESPLLDNSITQFIDNGGNREVSIGSAKTAYKNGTVKLNKQGDCFTGVPEEVWNFYVGGYQVCHKWLKDRKKRILSDEDINHYQRIVVALQETIKLMSLIDQAIPSFPIE